MLIENGIEIKNKTLVSLFSIVQPLHPNELTMKEFIKFSFDDHANRSMSLIKIIYRIQKHSEENKKDDDGKDS